MQIMCAGKTLTGLALAGIVSVFLAGCSGVESARGYGSIESPASINSTVSTVSTTVTTTQGTQAADRAEDPNAPTGISTGKDLADSFSHAEPGVYTDGSLDYRAMHDALEIKGRAPNSDYDRALFGQPWSDDVNVAGGHNGCDTRNDILQRDLDGFSIRNGTRGCLVESGSLVSPYSGETINFHRGDNQVDIEHVVALGDAWVKGAFQWDETKRRDFANDPINLLAVDASNNRAKGAADAATWLPPHKPFRCDYGRIQVHVKYVYDLWVTEAEHEALRKLLDQC